MKKIILGIFLSIVFSAVTSEYIVRADELDGYTIVDWEWNRDVETTDSNSVIVGGNIPFWRYVNKDDPTNNAIWKSAYGDELTDDEVTAIWSNELPPKYIIASVDVSEIPDEKLRNYIYEHISEDLPDLKFKFDIDADVEGDDNEKKASHLFNGNVGYRVYQDGSSCRIEMKFSPKFYLKKKDKNDVNNPENFLPNMPHKQLPRARYPYSSVVFSMWGFEGGTDKHYGALEVVEGDDPKYIYGKSFGYGDILEKGKIPTNKVYPNFEAGEINQEGVWQGMVEDDVLDSNIIRIGQKYKDNGDLWYYSYGGAVGYNFKFPFKVSLELEEKATKVTKRIINSLTDEILSEKIDNFDEDVTSKTYVIGDKNGNAFVDNGGAYKLERYEIKNGENEEILKTDNGFIAEVPLEISIPHKILDIYVTPVSEGDDKDNEKPTSKPNEDEVETTPLDPSICDSDTDTITWQERTSHTVYDYDGWNEISYTCYHTYTYRAKLNVDKASLSPDVIKSGYGLDAEIKVSVNYEQVNAKKSSNCSDRLGSRTPTNKPIPLTKATARLGWTSKTFDGEFVHGSMVNMQRSSATATSATFVAPHNNVTDESKLYTDLWLAGTRQEPRKHKIAFDIYGGGVNGTEWCTTAEKIFTINGDMYEDAGTTSTY